MAVSPEDFLVVALLILSFLGLLIAGWLIWQGRQYAAHLQEESRRQLRQEQTEHEKRVSRLQRKFDDWRERGHLKLAADLLPAFDALGHALDQSSQSDDVDALRDGLQMVEGELVAVLARHGIERCRPEAGTPFDPNIHEAVTVVEDTDVASGHVVECLRAGYVHQERVLRPASVAVAPRVADGNPAHQTSSDEPQAGISPADDSSPDEVDEAGPSADAASSSRA